MTYIFLIRIIISALAFHRDFYIVIMITGIFETLDIWLVLDSARRVMFFHAFLKIVHLQPIC